MRYIKKFFERKTSDLEQEVLLYMNDIENTDECVPECSPESIEKDFDVDTETSIQLFNLWKKNYDPKGNYDEVE